MNRPQERCHIFFSYVVADGRGNLTSNRRRHACQDEAPHAWIIRQSDPTAADEEMDVHGGARRRKDGCRQQREVQHVDRGHEVAKYAMQSGG